MSAQRVGSKKRRRIEAVIGEPVAMAWAHGGYSYNFVTTDHRHGAFDLKTSTVTWESPDYGGHYTFCLETWPSDVRGTAGDAVNVWRCSCA